TPGVPDFFQGSELWDLRLVDPDNRQPVDFPARAASLQNLARAAPESLKSSSHHQNELWNDGHIKLWLIRKTLQYRQTHAALFAEGELLPAEVRGPAAENILAFFRHHENAWALVVIPRWLAKTLLRPGTPIPSSIPFSQISDLFQDTHIALPQHAPERWRSVLLDTLVSSAKTSRPSKTLHVKHLLADFPFALYAA
ncbi:MAG TPA: malto-oligosyltrehalose synthase, partial [Candidatus Dormibacteraeota bacterium]|nr:malto-oligosyltrehalose synthase [Candidatus Dormibacteraeota bacterium]